MARIDGVSLELTVLLAILLSMSLLRLRSYRIIKIIIATTVVGIVWGTAILFWDAYQVTVDESWLSGSQQIVADIEKVDISATYSRLRLVNIKRDDGARLAGKVDVYLYGRERKASVLAGQLIRASVTLHKPRNKLNPGAFDYQAYCFDRHISLIGSAKNVVLVKHDIPLLEQVRERIVDALPRESDSSDPGRISKHNSDKTSGIIRALLLADRNHISTTVQESFAAAGAAHLLAISGLHVGMVAGWVFVIVWWLLTRREVWIVHLPVRKIALTAGLLMALFYATIAGWPITAQRSVLMMAAAILAWWLRSRSEPLNTMLAALMLLLLIDPAAILSVSLWLSFVAVTALLIWAGSDENKEDKSDVLFLRKWGAGLFWVSVLATLATLPIIADLFGRIPTYSLVANLLLIPLYSLYVLPLSILGEISAILGGGDVARWLFDFAAAGIAYGNSFLHTLKTWPAGNLWIPDVPLYIGLLYGVGMMMSVFFLLRKNYTWLLLCSACSLLIYLVIVIPEHYPEYTELTVWDVGQGAAATLSMPDGKVMVIDVPGRYGSRFNGGTMVAGGLRERGLVHANVLVLSHAQSDHAGGAERLLDHLRNIGEVWLADVPANHRYRTMNALVERILKQGGTVRWLKKGDELAFSDAKVDVLWPPRGFDPANDNHTSLVLSIRLASGEKLLLPADIEAAGEANMVQGGVSHHDVMLIPHHGSRTSSSDLWVKHVSPDVAIVQTGWENRYGFPKPDVMQRYRDQGTQLLDTKHGTVTIRLGKHLDKSLNYSADQGVKVEQYQAGFRGKRDTALQWWQWAL
ncbi:MAG: DNA internalization-related competence protein ComEC/Rec2 [Mariprofundaceae bacterium]